MVLLGNISTTSTSTMDHPNHNLKEISLEELQQLEEEKVQEKKKTETAAAAEDGSGPLTWDFDADLIA